MDSVHRRRYDRNLRRKTLVYALALMLVIACTSDNDSAGVGGSLLRIDDEPPGANCEFGGSAVHTGVDANDDGELADDEITETQYVCDDDPNVLVGKLSGNYTIRNELDALFLAQVTEITGDLWIDAPGLTSIALPSLQIVGGDIVFLEAGDLELVAFPVLTTAGSPDTEEALDTGNVGVRSGGVELDVSSLAELNGDVLLGGVIIDVSMPMLVSIRGRLAITADTPTLSFPKLTSIGGLGLSIDQTAVENLDGFAALTDVQYQVRLTNNQLLQDVSGLSLVSGDLTRLRISGSPLVEDLSGLEGITGVSSLYLANNAALQTLSGLNGLQSVWSLYLGQHPSITSLAGLSSLTSVTKVSLHANPLLSEPGPLLTSTALRTVYLRDNGFTSLAFPQNEFEEFTVAEESNLTAITAPNLTATSAFLVVQSCPTLSSISMPLLDSVSTGLFTSNPNLPACSIDALLAQLSSKNPTWTNTGNDDAATCP